jgi:hypothetical protein
VTSSLRSRFILVALLGFAAAVAVASAARAATYTRHPWLSLLTRSSVLIAWQTDVPAAGKVLYAVDPPAWSEASGGDATDHAIPLAELLPETTYRYRVVSGVDTLPDTLSFRTAPVSDAPYRFLAFGDLGRGTTAQRRIAARVDSLNADLVLLTGDIIYESGEPWNFTPYYFDIYRPTLSRIPFYPSLGNHDTYYDGGLSYLDQYHLPSNNPAGTERYYSFDYGNAHFVALDVTVENSSPDPAQVSWLDADLAATDRLWKFVFFHVPMYSNEGSHGSDPVIAAGFESIFQARGVDMVFQGHNHYYTRTYPLVSGAVVDAGQDPNYQNPGGPIYVVAGGGGRALHPLVPMAPIEVISKSVYHVAVVDVTGSSLTLRAVGADESVIDVMTLMKGTTTSAEVADAEGGAVPHRFTLARPRPNPSNGSVRMPFTMVRGGRVRARIVDPSGRLVRSLEIGAVGAGSHAITWDGTDTRGKRLPSGIYFGVFTAEGQEAKVRLTLLR